MPSKLLQGSTYLRTLWHQWVILPGQIEQAEVLSREHVTPSETIQQEQATELQEEREPEGDASTSPQPSPILRWSTRLRKPLDRFGTVVSFTDSDSEFEN